MLQRATLSIAIVVLVACATTEPAPIPLYPPSDHGYGFSAAEFSPDGRLAAVANFNTVWILDTRSMEEIMSFSGDYRFGTGNTLVFIDNELIASTGKTDSEPWDMTDFHAAVRIWSIRDRYADPVVIALPELGQYAIALDRSASRGHLAVGGENGAVAVLEPNGHGGYEKRMLPGLNGPVLDIIFNEDGSLLAAGGVHPGVVIWNTQTLKEVGFLPVKGNVHDLELIADKRTLLVAGDELRLWKFLTEEELKTIDDPTLAGDYITVGTAVAVYTIVAAMAGALGGTAPVPISPGGAPVPDYGFCTRVVDVSPSGAYLVDVHSGITKEKVRVIEVASDQVIQRLNPRGGRTCGVAFSPDGTKLLIANNRVARLYDTTSWQSQDFDLD